MTGIIVSVKSPARSYHHRPTTDTGCKTQERTHEEA